MKKRMRSLLLVCALLLSACATSPNKSTPAAASDTPKSTQIAAKPLAHEEAQSRFKQIAHVTYGLWFGLDKDNEDYEGRASIGFEVRPKAKDHGRDLFLDFTTALFTRSSSTASLFRILPSISTETAFTSISRSSRPEQTASKSRSCISTRRTVTACTNSRTPRRLDLPLQRRRAEFRAFHLPVL